jgi:glycosyltransferase involved in cell wall biosynthesis
VRILLTSDPLLPVPPMGYGGIERIVASLAEEFVRKDHEVGLVAHVASTVRVSRLFPWSSESMSGLGSFLRNSLRLASAVREFRPDVVHSFSRLAYLLPRLARRAGPTVMSYQRQTGGRGLAVAARIGGQSFAFTGCSEFICQLGRASGGTWRTIHNFVDVGQIPFFAAANADAPLLFLSRIEEIKGPHLAIAIARAAGRRLILAGNRVDSPRGSVYWSEMIAPALDRGDVEWVGEVDDTAKRHWLREAAALIVPIQWDEPFGIVFVEALAAGLPIITCRRGATPEIVEPGVTGFFVSGIDDGVAAVKALPTIDRRACRQRAELDFDVRVAAAQYLSLYEELGVGGT